MAYPTGVILVVGLTDSLIGEWTPRIKAFRDAGHVTALRPCWPAVTTSVQSSMLTGQPVSVHGIVGNGWYDREAAEVKFWKQSNRLVRAEKVWETARERDSSVTTLNMFWWYNMYSSAEWSVTPRPMYKADGRKVPDCYSEPPELRDELQGAMGRFPLFKFWGPASSIESSRWIASATMRLHAQLDPTLTLVYLPHLDYALQQYGPDGAEARAAAGEVDELVGMLLAFFEERGVRPMIVSEYGIEAVDRPVHVNRVLREAGLVRVREEDGLELLDPGASRAFAVADHQVAHVYVRDAGDREVVRGLCEGIEGVGRVLGRDEQVRAGIQHERSGDFVLEADCGAWFTYYYWLDDARAPDFARTVDIHRKPGYDPVELFIDPAIRSPKAALAWRLAKKKLGFRTLMDVIPLDATLVKGSHGRVSADVDLGESPLLITRERTGSDSMACTGVRDVILEHLFGAGR